MRNAFTVLELTVAVLIVVILTALAIVNFSGARDQALRKKCVANLRAIQYARCAYLAANPLSATCTPLATLVAQGYFSKKTTPTCPLGGGYSFPTPRTDVVTLPTCSKGHVIETFK